MHVENQQSREGPLAPAQVVEDVACTVCGCVCDDLRLSVSQGRIIAVDGACPLSRDWLLGQNSKRPPVAELDGQPVSLDVAVDESARVLAAARYPLVFGLSRGSTEGQQAAVRLADLLGATIDTNSSLRQAPSTLALQQVGQSTCTLGEIRHRADLVIYWGVDPVRSHPRHMERYATEPRGQFVPQGRRDRTLVVVDERPSETSRLADLFIEVDSGRDFEAIWTLRCLVQGRVLQANSPTGAPLEMLSRLASLMKSCRCGVVFFGVGLSRAGLGHLDVEGLLRLVTELNAHTRFHARRMRFPGDLTGAENVLCWQTGFPFAVNLSRGYPRYSPGEYSADDVLRRGEADACLFVGSEGVRAMSDEAVSHLGGIPTIALDHPTVETSLRPTVRFTTAVHGIHLPGTAYRMDDVPIPLRAVLPTEYPSDAEVLDRIRRRIAGR